MCSVTFFKLHRIIKLFLSSALIVAMPSFGLAATSVAETASVCEEASQYAASRVGVPLAVMQALTRTETGRRLEGQFLPWPWTVNMEGEGKWFKTPREALDYATEHYDGGARSFDIGCFQVNFKWHGEAFASIEDMFDPNQNALYAARFIASLYMELGSWTAAAGAYHSRTPEFARKYSDRFAQILGRMDGAVDEMLSADNEQFITVPPADLKIVVPREFAPLVPAQNLTGSLFTAQADQSSGLLLLARGSLLRTY